MRANTTDEFFIDAPIDTVQACLLSLGGPGADWWPRARATSEGGRLVVAAPSGRALAPKVRFAATIANIRPPEGFTWILDGGELRGRAEWWLERFKDGTIVHYFLDVERGVRGRRLSSLVRRHRWAIRRGMNALKDRLEKRA